MAKAFPFCYSTSKRKESVLPNEKCCQRQSLQKSDKKKPARFLKKSRNQWKAKYSKAKKTIIYLKNRERSLEKSRDHWKKQAQDAKEKLKTYEEQNHKKKQTSQTSVSAKKVQKKSHLWYEKDAKIQP